MIISSEVYTLSFGLNNNPGINQYLKSFNFSYNSSAIEAAYEILNSITKPPAERQHEVLLIKFASAFVPFMEELHGYHPGLEVAFAAPLSQKLNIDGKDKKVPEQKIQLQSQPQTQPRTEPIRKAPRLIPVKGMKATSSVLSQIKRALDLPAPMVPPAKRTALEPSIPFITPSIDGQLSSPFSTHDTMDTASTSNTTEYSQGTAIKEEEDTSWIKVEELEYDQPYNYDFQTYPSPGSDGQGEIPMEAPASLVPPHSPLILKAPTLVPKQLVSGSCRYCFGPSRQDGERCQELPQGSLAQSVHNAQYTLWKLTACSSRFKLHKKANSVMRLSMECPFCPEQLKSLTHFVGHMELLHRRFCSYEHPIFECARKGCKRKTARCYEMFQHWHESPDCKDGLKFDYVESRKMAKMDMAKKREEYGIATSPCYPVTEE
ncbi:hypothetical protein PRIPAC_94787 [Pristionchus pacificus]|uniref:Uncharacterized protein n=1 Tax=Pristionchus pacificus TaxID=54126 RepID=A0A2A6BB48_PRIPA|nr:hypothetical protein PRIPAC_94787 [Pristionchus pacificus]|eukprot:PDM63103.1 hypothetical protein PRIPAC_50318 [Pristionchus pacificus]